MCRPKDIVEYFKEYGNPEKALEMKAYMRYQFEFLGIASIHRKKLTQNFFSSNGKPSFDRIHMYIRELWMCPYREIQYVAQELLFGYRLQFTPAEWKLLRLMVINQSWWDTVDYIATKLTGHMCRLFPQFSEEMERKWAISENIWERRTAILFQLKYKTLTDTNRLQKIILQNLNSDEFFIRKAIGWALREYSKTNRQWVSRFVNETSLHPLSRREALKWMNRNKD